MSSTKIWEPDRISGLPEFDASDARWIGELLNHQMRCGDHGSCPAVLYKVAIDAPTNSLFPSIAESSQSAPLQAEKARRIADRDRVNRLLASRPFPSDETRLFKGLIAGDSGCHSYHATSYWFLEEHDYPRLSSSFRCFRP
eukprot:3305235-Heterocapsa_arctica.AAC.1